MNGDSVGEGGRITVILDDALLKELRQVARRFHIGIEEAASRCHAEGVKKAVEARDSWREQAQWEGLLDRLDSFRSEKRALTQRLMDVRSEKVAESFNSFEEFNHLTTNLISYAGKRAEAKRLQELLAKRGVSMDISPGELPDFEELTRKYLFRKKAEPSAVKW
jgi:hypothetical protein